MTFTVKEFHDLVVIMETQPEWRSEMRRLVLTDDVLRLPLVVRELSDNIKKLEQSQDRTDQSLKELSNAQRRTDESLKELSNAQRRTDESLKELSNAQRRTELRVEEVAEGQKRTELRVEELAEGQKRTDTHLERLDKSVTEFSERTETHLERLDKSVADLFDLQKITNQRLTSLENKVGVTTEEEAEGVVRAILEQKGYELIADPLYLRWNGDVDVVLPMRDPQGKPAFALVEAKVRLSYRAVEAWAHRAKSLDFVAALQAQDVPGPYLVYAYGMRVDSGARQAGEKFGIGVAHSQGEQVPPGETA